MTVTRGPAAGTAVLAVAVLVAVGLAGWLLWPSPPSASVLRTGTSHYSITATIDSPRIGTTAVTIDLAARDGAVPTTMAGMAGVTVEAVMPLMGFATPAVPVTGQGGGRHTAAGLSLTMTGPWELYVSVSAPDGTTETAMLPFTVSG